MYKVKSPVLFLVFNRPLETQKLFNAIRTAQPSKFYIAADGPRNNGKDNELCEQVKNIVNQIDWECDVKTLYRDKNLGCKLAVSQAITWFFDNVEEGIVLEDDCLPSTDFFRFCDELLEKYRNSPNVGHICGSNFLDNIKSGDGDYYYSKLPYIWGWASWRRTWDKYDIEMADFINFQKYDLLNKITDNKYVKKNIYSSFLKTYKGEINTWDHQYFYSNIVNDVVSIIPNYNLITNIGFNENGTHTFDSENSSANRKHKALPMTIKSPSVFKLDRKADAYFLEKDLPSQKGQIVCFVKRCVIKTLKYLGVSNYK